MSTPAPPPRTQRLTARQLRRTVYDLELRPGWTIGLRRASMLTALFSGKIPLPLLEVFTRLGTTGMPATEIFALPDEGRESVFGALRWYACAVVADPIVVPEDDGDPTHVPVDVFTLEELFLISNALPPADVVEDPTSPGLVVTEDDAARFPGATRVDPHPLAPVGDDLRATAVDVDLPAVVLQHG